MIDAKLLKRIIQECPDPESTDRFWAEDNLAAHLAAELKAIESIRRDINNAAADRLAEIQRHQREMALIDEGLTEARKRCKHWTRTHHPDPSGGSDSHYTCDICGERFE